ncbi:MAG TPA: ChaN family lipoprotein [Nitrospirota bacterium]|nr:ChaN family lipoprotein [Nitrospirota bacterium]
MSRFFLYVLFISLFPCVALPNEPSAPAVPEYNLSVSFDIPASRITGLAIMPARDGREILFSTGKLAIIEVTLNDRTIAIEPSNGMLRIKPTESGTLAIKYEGVFKGSEYSSKMNNVAEQNMIDARGISLTGTWYPRTESLTRYRLKASLPNGYDAVSEAERIDKTAKGSITEFTFYFYRQLPGISLIASDRFEVTQDRVSGVKLYAYFFPEDRGLAKTYIQYAKKYIELYEQLLVKYPYERFSIVESFLPAGYSLPTFTLLGQDVVRLPFIPETSLGHEILHQWFGNSVYVALDKGNWSEGLTTYLADHLYEEQAGKGWEYRKEQLIAYDAYVNPENEISLREFTNKTDRAARAVGYGKGAMIFHMLKNLVGEEQFYSALREFISRNQSQQASWDNIKAAFEKQSGKDLALFFKHWVDEKGLQDLSVTKASVKRNGDTFEVSFDVLQKGKAFSLDLPAAISMRGDIKKEKLSLDGEKKSFNLLVDDEPRTMIIDGAYDIARRLTEQETPPVVASLLGDKKPLIALPVANKEAYKTVIAALKEGGAEEKEAADLKDSEITDSSLVILGDDNPLVERLFGKVESVKAGFSLTVKKNPWSERKVAVIINSHSVAEAEAAFPKISHYGRYSVLAFNEGQNILKKIDDSQKGMEMELREQAAAIDLSTIRTLSDIIDGAAGKKIIYVGEYHDRFSHHTVELDIVKGLYMKNEKLAVGMEMFQRPFQKTLDDYIKGAIDEREFLKNTEYFKRWGFDYNLYKPILDFARAKKIPVVALNLRREITDKVSKGGIDSLSAEEKKEIPQQMDFSDSDYRDQLKEVFEQHKSLGERDFDYFYESQVLWDETMAMSIDEYLRKNPDHRMVVLAGGGHISYGFGIPKRAFRRNGYAYTIILNDGALVKDIAHYLVFPQPLDGVTAPKIMALLSEKDGKITITGFPNDSVSEKAGIKVGDTLVSLDGIPISTIEDIKLFLFYKKKEEPLKVKVERKRFLLGDKELEFEVHLQ